MLAHQRLENGFRFGKKFTRGIWATQRQPKVRKSNSSSFLAYRNHGLPEEFPPTLVPCPHYSTMRLSSDFTMLSLSTSKIRSTPFKGTGSSMGWLSNHMHP